MTNYTDKKKNTLFEIVNDNDEIIGLEEMENIWRDGFRIRTSCVWFFTPKGDLIFQRRGKNNAVLPDLLDSTVGGKVEPGATYEETAIVEGIEETGIVIEKGKLIPLRKVKRDFVDHITNSIIKNFSMQYGYFYPGDIKDLQVEEGKATSFEVWHIDKILTLSEEEKKLFVKDFVTAPELLDVFKQIKKLI